MAMYKTFVAHQVRKAFARLSQGDHQAVNRQLADNVVYEFAGDHALGGRRTGRELIESWFERMARLFGTGQFVPQDILVKGWPWATRVVSIVDISSSIGGEPYANRMIQVMDMKWARVTAIYTLEDTQHLARALDRAAANGLAEAAAAPIVG